MRYGSGEELEPLELDSASAVLLAGGGKPLGKGGRGTSRGGSLARELKGAVRRDNWSDNGSKQNGRLSFRAGVSVSNPLLICGKRRTGGAGSSRSY